MSLPPMTTVLSGWEGAGAGEYRSPITMGSRASCAQWSAVATCHVSGHLGGSLVVEAADGAVVHHAAEVRGLARAGQTRVHAVVVLTRLQRGIQE